MEIAKAQNEIRCAKADVEKASNRLAFCLSAVHKEIAKAQNEIRCAKADVEKASNRLAFCLSAVHNLKDRLDKDIQE